MTNEEILTAYMQKHYTDEKLAALLAHAQDGKLVFDSCCCFIGIPTADHALRGHVIEAMPDHFMVAKFGPEWRFEFESKPLPEAEAAERAFCGLANTDELRAKRVIPLILAEMKRREELKSKTLEPKKEYAFA